MPKKKAQRETTSAPVESREAAVEQPAPPKVKASSKALPLGERVEAHMRDVHKMPSHMNPWSAMNAGSVCGYCNEVI